LITLQMLAGHEEIGTTAIYLYGAVVRLILVSFLNVPGRIMVLAFLWQNYMLAGSCKLMYQMIQ